MRPRVIPLVNGLQKLFERRWNRRKIELRDGSTFLAELVFHRNGKPIRSMRKSWDKALEDAKLLRRTWHDFRRTAARNMVNAGVPEGTAMLITGHRTRSIFDRYAIRSQADAAEAIKRTIRHVSDTSNVKTMKRKGAK